MDVPWRLYRASADGGEAHELLAGVRDPNDVQVSPDGRWVALVAEEVDGHGQGVFAISIATREVIELFDGAAFRVAWSPGGDEIAVAARQNPNDPDVDSTSDLLRIDVRDALADGSPTR